MATFMSCETIFHLFLTTHLVAGLIVIAFGHGDDTNVPSAAFAYDSEKFTEELNRQNHLVMFYAPWCGHCKRLAPTWEDVAAKYNNRIDDESEVIVAKVDCTVETKLCSEQDITGYPTIKYFRAESPLEGVKYRGRRELDDITNFINEQLGQKPVKKVEPEKTQVLPNKLYELSDDDFKKHISSGDHFVKFYAPWCGHCQRLSPTWDALSESLSSSGVKLSKVDCTVHSSTCTDNDIKGYPTLLYFRDGKLLEKYQGTRSHEDLKTFVSKMQDVNDIPAATVDKGVVVTLTSENFENAISSGITFVKFFAPWCGHSKNLAPIWEQVATKLIPFPVIKIAEVDCDKQLNKALCADNGVEGYPTLYVYNDGELVTEYKGERSVSEIVEYARLQIHQRDEL